MSTFIDPVKVRRLAASGDNFWKGAAWVLDQQDAARIDPTDYESEWKPVRNRAGQAYPMPTGSSIDEMRNMVRAVRNAADLGAPRVP